MALRDIADAQGDVDAFIAQYDPETRKVPRIAAEISGRLLAAGRAAEALKRSKRRNTGAPTGQNSSGKTRASPRFDALDRRDDAQAARWSCFERFLSARHLRDYLKRLPDFDDIEAENRALDFAESFEPFSAALSFLAVWPAPDRAAKLVLARAEKLDGDRYEFLTPVAEVLAGKHPLAATLALARYDRVLSRSRQVQSIQARRATFSGMHESCSSIADFGQHETHETFVARMRGKHGKKSSFWNLLP